MRQVRSTILFTASSPELAFLLYSYNRKIANYVRAPEGSQKEVRLKIIFYGSLDSSRSDFSTIEENLKSLVAIMVRERAGFVLRSLDSVTPSSFIPVDTIIQEALVSSAEAGKKIDATVLHEPGDPKSTSWGFPYKSYTASTSSRIQFYSELLELVDLVVGVGGQQGLLRLAISCEWARHPMLILPGSGGSSELLWRELFVKSFQIQAFPPELVSRLKEMPYLNLVDKSYGTKAHAIIRTFLDGARKYGIGSEVKPLLLSADSFTLGDALKTLRHFSFGLWTVILSIVVASLSIAYNLGKIQFVETLFAWFTQNQSR